ncbi:MAG: VPLPA-CTERM sorting domain-containing protein [Parvularculaceae bacterium]
MKKLIAIAAIAASMAFAPAHATLVDFANEADTNGERGVMNGDVLTINGISMTFNAIVGGQDGFAYLDAGEAGLGVCGTLDMSLQCDPSSDDNVTVTETVSINFVNATRDIFGLIFRDSGHFLINAANDGMITVTTDNGSQTALMTVFMQMAAMSDAFFADTSFVQFDYVDTEFYISAIDVEAPLPAALPFFLTGIAAYGASKRRKKTA